MSYLIHSSAGTSWTKKDHKYIEKKRSKSGKWYYVYPNPVTSIAKDIATIADGYEPDNRTKEEKEYDELVALDERKRNSNEYKDKDWYIDANGFARSKSIPVEKVIGMADPRISKAAHTTTVKNGHGDGSVKADLQPKLHTNGGSRSMNTTPVATPSIAKPNISSSSKPINRTSTLASPSVATKPQKVSSSGGSRPMLTTPSKPSRIVNNESSVGVTYYGKNGTFSISYKKKKK